MRLEHIPILLGVLFGLIGAGLVADALIADGTFVATERRRRARAPRHPRGELLVGVGVLAIAAALAGRDDWRWGTVAVLAGVLLVTAGALLNRHFIAELFSNRGALRRADDGTVTHERAAARRASPARGQVGDPTTPGAAPGVTQRAPQRAPQGTPQGATPGTPRAHVVRRAPPASEPAVPPSPVPGVAPAPPAPPTEPPSGPTPPEDRRSAPRGGNGPRRIR